MGLGIGEAAPWVRCATPSNPRYTFSGVAGRWVLLACAPDAQSRTEAMARLRALGPRIDAWNLLAFVILREPAAIAAAQDEPPGLRFMLDPDGEVASQFKFDTAGGWLLLDPTLRVMGSAPIAECEALFAMIAALPRPEDHAGVAQHAPVLTISNVFEPEVCRKLIAHYEADGGEPSGVMREIDGRTVGVLDDFKRRRDAFVTDPKFQRSLRARVLRRLMPEIERAFQFRATRIERYIVACYDAETGGYFRPHRDDTTKGTAHRKFAVSINLNQDFEGGDLRFPEFGPRTYRPPAGGAVVFSCSMLHEATPVIRGRRYAFLPFLYDEDGARIREANLQYLDAETPPASAA